MDIAKVCKNFPAILLDPHQKRGYISQKEAWAISVICAIPLGIPHLISAAFRSRSKIPLQPNDTHAKIREIWGRLFGKKVQDVKPSHSQASTQDQNSSVDPDKEIPPKTEEAPNIAVKPQGEIIPPATRESPAPQTPFFSEEDTQPKAKPSSKPVQGEPLIDTPVEISPELHECMMSAAQEVFDNRLQRNFNLNQIYDIVKEKAPSLLLIDFISHPDVMKKLQSSNALRGSMLSLSQSHGLRAGESYDDLLPSDRPRAIKSDQIGKQIIQYTVGALINYFKEEDLSKLMQFSEERGKHLARVMFIMNKMIYPMPVAQLFNHPFTEKMLQSHPLLKQFTQLLVRLDKFPSIDFEKMMFSSENFTEKDIGTLEYDENFYQAYLKLPVIYNLEKTDTGGGVAVSGPLMELVDDSGFEKYIKKIEEDKNPK